MNAMIKNADGSRKNIHEAVAALAKARADVLATDRHCQLEIDIMVALHDDRAESCLKRAFEVEVLPKDGGVKDIQQGLSHLRCLRDSDLFMFVDPQVSGILAGTWDLLTKVATSDVSKQYFATLTGTSHLISLHLISSHLMR